MSNFEIEKTNTNKDEKLNDEKIGEKLELKILGKCRNCKVVTSMRCKKCKVAYFCSKDCQKKLWSRHKILCNRVLRKCTGWFCGCFDCMNRYRDGMATDGPIIEKYGGPGPSCPPERLRYLTELTVAHKKYLEIKQTNQIYVERSHNENIQEVQEDEIHIHGFQNRTRFVENGSLHCITSPNCSLKW